jgi:hypothetical protein
LSRKLLQPRTQTPAFVFRSSSTTAARPLSLTVFIRHGLQLTSPSGISQGNDTETISMAPALRMTYSIKETPTIFLPFQSNGLLLFSAILRISRVRVMLSAIFLSFGLWALDFLGTGCGDHRLGRAHNTIQTHSLASSGEYYFCACLLAQSTYWQMKQSNTSRLGASRP